MADKKEKNIISNEEYPIGFTMEIAQHTDTLNRFAQLSEQEQREVIDGARDIHSRNEMRSYVQNIFK